MSSAKTNMLFTLWTHYTLALWSSWHQKLIPEISPEIKEKKGYPGYGLRVSYWKMFIYSSHCWRIDTSNKFRSPHCQPGWAREGGGSSC